MKNKIWITVGAILVSLFLIMVACEKEPEKPAVPAVPTGLSVVFTNAYENIVGGYVANCSFSWNEVKDAEYYELYRSENSSGPYECWENYIYETNYDIGLVGGSLDEDIDWYVKVKAVNSSGSSSLSNFVHCYYSYNGGGGGNGGGSSTISAPSSVSAEVHGPYVRVTWNSVSNASYYKIYRASSSSGSYSMLETAYGTYYFDSNPNTDNYYKVTAVSNSGDESNKSDYAYCYYSNGGGGSVPSAPSGVSAEVSGSQIRVSWNSVSTATQYTVYRSTSVSGSYTSIGTTSSTYYYDGNPSTDNYYKVKAKNSNGESSYSSYAYCYYSSGGGGGGGGSTNYAPCPPTVLASGTANSISVSWTKATGTGCGTPTSYEVYKQNPFSYSWDLKTTTSSTSYRDTDVHPGMNRYAVKAINQYGSDIGYGNSSSITLPKPTSFSAQKSGSEYIKFTWSKVSQATGYQIFICTTSSYGNYVIFEQIDDVNATTITKYYPGESGHTYYFKIRAVWITSGTYEYSDFTTYKSVTF